MRSSSRREFLADVGRGMLVASVGTALASDLSLAPAWADDGPKPLNFGADEPLVALMQDTPADKLLPALVEKLRQGTELKQLVTAAALANARTFGGQDYIGYHSFMALLPAYQMAQELPSDLAPLPVLKVIFRNTSRMQAQGGRSKEVLHEVAAAELPKDRDGGELLRDAARAGDIDKSERTFAALVRGPLGEAYNHLQFEVEDEVDVHRVVLSWRAWATLDLAGEAHAHTLLRQSVRYCASTEQNMKSRGHGPSAIRTVLPKLLDEHKLVGRELGTKKADDAWLEKFSHTIANGSREEAAGAMAAALAEGFALEDLGEALSLASNELLLRDPGRGKDWANADKPEGSVHGDSVGVHASDSANAWRNISRVSSPRNAMASLIVGAFHTAGQQGRLSKEFYPTAAQLEAVKVTTADDLLKELEGAVKEKNQFLACALVQKYAARSFDAAPVFALLLRYGISEDGALHAEKYYRTVREEYEHTRLAFRSRQLVALARVTASEYGKPAPGYAQARELLKV